MRKALLALIIALTLLPVAFAAMQDSPAPTIEITGVNPTELPVITVTTTVLDSLGQPVDGLTAASFQVVGELADQAQIVSVRRIEDENLTVAVVLVIDVSSSMAGRPFADAQEAAKTFINTMDNNTTIAIVTFSNSVQLVQDFTTDKSTLLSAIDSLSYGGQTALYEGALVGVQKAAQAPSPRRFVVLLSDGAQYETDSLLPSAPREAAATEALVQGVPVYTIGLGFGADRSYLDQIASLTNARFFESPSSNQLQQVYTNLAQLLRSQYEVVLNIDLPADGTFYDLGLQVTTQQGTVSASASLRTPIPIPIVQAPILDGPVSEVIEARAAVLSDDGVTSVEIKLDGVTQMTLTEEPYSYMLDPFVLTPGEHQLEYIATDTNGDIGSDVLEFSVASLESTVTFIPELPTEEISQTQTYGLQITGQTLPQTTTYSVDGGEPTLLVPPAYAFTIDPLTTPPGEHTFTFTVLNQAGVTTTVERTITIADLPPKFVVTGLQDGDVVSEPVEVQVEILFNQGKRYSMSFGVEAGTLFGSTAVGTGRPDDRSPEPFTIDPMDFAPGPGVLGITISNELRQSASTQINFKVAALPPEVTVTGIDLGETIEDNREIMVDAVTQLGNRVNSVVFLLDNVEISRADAAPTTFALDASTIEPGPHVLSVTTNTEGGQSTTSDIAFIVGEGPSLTLTAMVTPTDTPTLVSTNTPTPTPTFTPSPTPTIDTTATAVAQVALLQITTDAQSTADAVIAFTTSQAQAQIAATGTADAANLVTSQAQATSDAQATTAAQTTLDSQAAIDAQATVDKQATISAAVDAANATAIAQATLNTDQQATLDVQTTADALLQATADTQATTTAEAEATEQAIARATANIEATSVVQTVQAVLTATQMLADQQATLDAQATANAQATTDAQETLDAEAMAAMVATANAPLTMTADAQTTLNAQATLNTLATANAQSTLNAQATLNAQVNATANAQATLDAQASATADAQNTFDAQATMTAEAQLTADAQATLDALATATQLASNAQATRNAHMTLTAEAQLTADAQATLDALATATQSASNAQATRNAQATLDTAATATADVQVTLGAQETLDAQASATAIAQATLDAQAALASETEVVTEEPTEVQPTEAGTPVAQAATETSATATLEEIDRTSAPTVTPIGTLIPQQAETAPESNNALPILIIIGIGVVILVIVSLVLSRARRNNR